MQRVSRSFAVLCLALSGAGVVPLALAGAQDAVVKEITRLENAWGLAETKHDGATVGKMWMEDFLFTAGGSVQNKAQRVAAISGGKDEAVSSNVSEVKVLVHGGTAVALGVFTVTYKTAKGTEVQRFRWTDTWLKQSDGAWQCLAGQSEPMPK